MSHDAYNLVLEQAMDELKELSKNEAEPEILNDVGRPQVEDWPDDEIFQFLAVLYIKYIDIYRKLEECYDQCVHPQKRIFIKKTLECTICRICELKYKIIQFNPRKKSLYVHLDQLLFDLKYDPTIIEIPVPRYFREDDQIPVDLVFTEKIEREGGAKKKKKKAGGKKKKKKVEEEEKKVPAMPLVEKQALINQIMLEAHNTDEHEVEVHYDPFNLEIDIVQAIYIIWKNDIGRQGRERLLLIFKSIQQQMMAARLKRELNEGKMEDQNPENQENESCLFMQKYMRGILARIQVKNMREEEMDFLGMSQRKTVLKDGEADPVEKMETTMAERKLIQEAHQNDYSDALVHMEQEIDTLEGTEIMEKMLKERREWIMEQRVFTSFPKIDDLKGFYDRNKDDKMIQDDDADRKEKKSAKQKEQKKKDDRKGKKKGKKSGDDDEKVEKIKIGPSEVVRKFDTFNDEYKDVWKDREEAENFAQNYDVDLTRAEVEPILKEKYQKDIDDMIMIELENLRLMAGGGKKKKTKKKKKKSKKKGKKKGLKLPGWKMIKEMSPKELLTWLIQYNVVKKLPPQNLTDFIGEFNYIHSMLDDIKERPYDPSMALIRQIVTEYIIFPLGSELVRKRFPENCRSFLFYGPPGTGKTMVVRACVTETNSVLFDMSPSNIEGLYQAKKEEERLVASVMVAAKEYQPSIIYIDEVEKVVPAKKKGKKGKKGSKKKLDPSDPKRIKKPLGKWRTKFIDDKTRITIIGCTSEPEEGSKKEFKKFFDRQIYFPFPDYTTRRMMWRHFMQSKGAIIKSEFPLSTLAHISHGYSAGSIKKTCNVVLTKYRIESQEKRPLTLPEFIGPLSICQNTMDEQYEEFLKFTDFITGDQKRRDEAEARISGEDGGAAKKKKKGKK